ncbi:MAG: hypothetical protein ACRKFN_07535 [Desulfitobacterium sp.]
MNRELNDKLQLAQQGLVRLHKIDAMLKELEAELQELQAHEYELKRTLEKENIDVEKLQNRGLAAFFYSIIGSLDERIEKERNEVLAAELKYTQAVKDIKDINFSIAKLTSERTNYLQCQIDYDALYAQKRTSLLEKNAETAQMILELTNESNRKRINLKEIDEALLAGERVLSSLNNALSSLSSAAGWGTWDLLGGGLISDLAKHSHLNSAQSDIEEAQMLLREFKTELTDIRVATDINLKTDGFVKFADFFFDGLIADWFMQTRINESQSSIENAKSQVQTIIEKLDQLKEQDQDRLGVLDTEISNLIVTG